MIHLTIGVNALIINGLAKINRLNVNYTGKLENYLRVYC